VPLSNKQTKKLAEWFNQVLIADCTINSLNQGAVQQERYKRIFQWLNVNTFG